MTVNLLPQLPCGYRYGIERSIRPQTGAEFFPPQGCVIKSVNFGDGVVICVPIQWYIKQLDLWVTV
ncbi:hypothetical protein NUKP37_50710 [Klebsiella variicola]|jgi:hypothetical protein|uniref:Uncharacterized protein n=5 Tax=Enterobacteriaceae TaxID=543 RepID=A0A9P3PC35_KLEVA|nr:hypothetical protein [Klebsiella pneumoniae]BCU61049.1 hypothetical protein KLVA_32080 [Klebsiella variicola]GKO39713.1 hypothetical protein NUBL21974_08460 [Klebsiella quasipneumoniae]DAE59660.1 MAG TPA: hypothetical protein [Caudoviricetes sp.]BBE04553.1 hypothetical protein KPGSU103_C32710 [Klebsiella pneumoniae]